MDARHAEQLRDLARHQRVHHMVGLQGRRNPAVNYVRDLVTEGYVGKVLGATLTESTPMFWDAQLPPGLAWAADTGRGVNLLTVVGGHALDTLRHCLGEFREVSATTATRTPRATAADTGETVEVSAPDQVLVQGMLESGALASPHFQGGAPQGLGARLEIQGSQGALIITGSTLNASELTVTGTREAGQCSELPVPNVAKLDFADFHPLDHYPLSARCRALPGGTRRHFAYTWEFKWPAQLRTATLCRLGFHQMMRGWTRDCGKPRSICRNCWRTW